VEPWFSLPPRSFDAEAMLHVIDAPREAVARYCRGFPSHMNPSDISLKLAGAGGDGAQTAAMLIAAAAINEGFDGTHIPSYGPESRGGTSYADVHVAIEEVLNPASPAPDILVAFNAPSLAKVGLAVRQGDYILYDASVARDVKPADTSVTVVGVPFTEIAPSLGKLVVKNIITTAGGPVSPRSASGCARRRAPPPRSVARQRAPRGPSRR
jgi:2-oxoisovalerate ferredoxin oxidoreductase beta subunit